MDDVIDTSQNQSDAHLDSIDTPDCFGEFTKKNKLCAQYCAVALKCSILKGKNPKMDVLERLLVNNQYAVKLH
ncbi:MAG: hypothetical protein D3926_07340 [Desulfobacteraceae bacterium]|nr:MAG: hypothetical protein D3926_07340 [Desulfobacteraceae bacterium]